MFIRMFNLRSSVKLSVSCLSMLLFLGTISASDLAVANQNGEHDTSPAAPSLEENTNSSVTVTRPPAKKKVGATTEVGQITSAPHDGQVDVNVLLPNYECPNDENVARLIRACAKKKPSPIGNIVLDAGHWLGSMSDRSQGPGDSIPGLSMAPDRGKTEKADNIHEGNLNMGAVMMAKDVLDKCYGVGKEFVKLLRNPGERKFGEFHNATLADSTLEKWEPKGLGSRSIQSLYRGDDAQRKSFARFLLGNGSPEIEEKSSYWQIHANQSMGTAEYKYGKKTYEIKRKVDYIVALYHKHHATQNDKDMPAPVPGAIASELSPSIAKVREYLQSKVDAAPEGSRQRAEMMAHLRYFERDITPQGTLTRFKENGYARTDGWNLGILNRKTSTANSKLVWSGLKSSVNVVEGIFMSGFMGDIAHAEINENDKKVRENFVAWNEAKASGAEEKAKAAKEQFKESLQNSTVQVRERVYDAKKGEWVVHMKRSYHAPSVYIQYSKGLGRGIANSYKKRCEAAGVKI